MAKGTKKTKDKLELELRLEFAEALKSWNHFIMWLKEEDNQEKLHMAMEYEIENACRPAFIDRIRTRFNKVRAYNELKAIEARIGKVINVNHV